MLREPKEDVAAFSERKKVCGSCARISFAKQLGATMAGKKVGRGHGPEIDRALLAQGLVVGTNSGRVGRRRPGVP